MHRRLFLAALLAACTPNAKLEPETLSDDLSGGGLQKPGKGKGHAFGRNKKNVTIATIPDITLDPGEKYWLGRYIFDKAQCRTGSQVLGLTDRVSYDPEIETLTGLMGGTERGLQLEVTF